MLQIDQAYLESLGFDFEQAVAQFQQAREAHRFTIDVPAPTAHWLVEAAVNAGGYQVVSPPSPAAQPEQNEPSAPLSQPSTPAPEAEPPMLAEQVQHRQRLMVELYNARAAARNGDPRAILKQVLDLLLQVYGFDSVTDESVDQKLDDLAREQPTP